MYYIISQNYRLSEAGKVVVYTTSVKIVRETYDRCIKVIMIFTEKRTTI